MLHWGPGRRFVRWGPSGDADASALIAAMSVPPDAARQILINQLITALKAAGVWPKLDMLHVFAAHDNQAGRLNWKNPALYNVTGASIPAFVVDRGYTGAGTTAFTTNFNPATAGGQYTQDSAHYGWWGNTEAVTAGVWATTVGGTNFVVPQTTASTATMRINTAGATTLTATSNSTIAHMICIRRDAANQIFWRNGVTTSGAHASGALGSANFVLFNNAANSSPYLGQVSAHHAGGALSDVEAAAFSSALATYRTAVGL